eukprot:6465838-Alexandrium_andersonii.AAC.1
MLGASRDPYRRAAGRRSRGLTACRDAGRLRAARARLARGREGARCAGSGTTPPRLGGRSAGRRPARTLSKFSTHHWT